jgi:beta-lactamase regulating signal transducer with metallopeptidase domain
MTLSYTLRLLCILVVVSGLALGCSQIGFALFSRLILRRLDASTARSRERILYLLQIGPALFAVFVAAALCLPAWLHGETNVESESVGSLCLLAAALTGLWFACTLLRGLRITVRTLRFTRACRHSAQRLRHNSDIPVLVIPDPGPPLRLVGFLRPLILVSPALGSLGTEAFDLALAHERSHAVHRDNWKLLTLSFVPRFDRLLPGSNPFAEPWQRAADWAADDDAAAGDSARSLLLAEALVTSARVANSAPPPYICTALTTADAALAVRIHRLLHPRRDPQPSRVLLLVALASLALFGAAALAGMSPLIYELCERLLHFGTA